MYFIRQTSSWQQNNSLKKYLGPILKDLNGQQVEDPDAVGAYLTAKLAFANRHFKKCTPVQLTTRSLKPMVDATEYITLGTWASWPSTPSPERFVTPQNRSPYRPNLPEKVPRWTNHKPIPCLLSDPDQRR